MIWLTLHTQIRPLIQVAGPLEQIVRTALQFTWSGCACISPKGAHRLNLATTRVLSEQQCLEEEQKLRSASIRMRGQWSKDRGRHALPPSLIHPSIACLFYIRTQEAWLLSMIAGVGLQGFGRLALAKVYVKTEAVINDAASATATAAAQAAPARGAKRSASGGRHNDGVWGGSTGGGSDAIGARQRERDDKNVPGLLQLNGVSSSIGEMMPTAPAATWEEPSLVVRGSPIDLCCLSGGGLWRFGYDHVLCGRVRGKVQKIVVSHLAFAVLWTHETSIPSVVRFCL